MLITVTQAGSRRDYREILVEHDRFKKGNKRGEQKGRRRKRTSGLKWRERARDEILFIVLWLHWDV